MNLLHHPPGIVIGGGIVGWSVALAFAERGHPVHVIDAADSGAATMAGAGIITLGTSQHLPLDYPELATNAIAWYPHLVRRLADQDAGDTGYARVGALHIAFSDDEADRLHEVVALLKARRSAAVNAHADIRIVTGAEARDLVPPVSERVPAAVWYADAARVNGRLMRMAIRTAAMRLGCTEAIGSAALERANHHAVVIHPDGSRSAPDFVIVAGGAWSTALGMQIGIRLPIVPQRGQIAHFQWSDDSTARWPSVETASRYYMLAFPGGRVVSGATRELKPGFDARVTAEGMHEVIGHALAIAPRLGDRPLIEMRVGLRPFSPDGLPGIGLLPGTDNCWICAGHGPSGLTLGPYSGELLAQMAIDQQPAIDPTPYLPDRWL